jgi:hypothetical protein
MFGEFSQNYLAQAKESENAGSNILKQSFIKIKDTLNNVGHIIINLNFRPKELIRARSFTHTQTLQINLKFIKT